MAKNRLYVQFAIVGGLLGLFALTPSPFKFTILLLATSFVLSVEWL